jgi:quercetin dioxygenase-like cupin family protein
VNAVTWTDTRAMDWGTFPGLGGGNVKVLHVDGEGVPVIMLVHLPPGDLGVKIPHRHHHVTVYEQAYHLAGDFPHAEWASAESDDHEVVIFREGWFLDRKPGSLHGLDHMFGDSGAVVLSWRSGPGNWIDEPNAAEETIDVDFHGGFVSKGVEDLRYAQPGTGIVLDAGGARIIDTREMDWAPVDDTATRVRVLSVDANREPTVRQVFLPPGQIAPPPLATAADEHEFALVLEGELTVQGADGPQVVKQDAFMIREPGAPEALVPIAPSPTGAMLLQWRIGPNSWAPFPESQED